MSDWVSTYLPPAAAVGVVMVFVMLVLPNLATVPHDYDEAWLILDARDIARGLRPFADFPHHEMPLHLYLLLWFGQVFGQGLVGYRLLSVASLGGSALLLFCLVRPFGGAIAALVAETAFLWSPTVVHALPAIPETPAVFFTLLAVVLLFLGARPWSAMAAGVTFVVALFVKPTCLLMVGAAAVSLAVGREWRRLVQLTASGVVTAIVGIGLWDYLSDGAFAEQLQFQITRIATRSAGMWTIDSGFADMRRQSGLDTPLKWTLSNMEGFFETWASWLPMGLFVVSLFAIPIWLIGCARSRPALGVFAVLWPVAYVVVNFVVFDFVSPRYFIAFLGFSAFLLAGWFWFAQRGLPTAAVAMAGGVLGLVLLSQLASTLRTQRDPYLARAAWMVQHFPRALSFSPILFAATGTAPGCGFSNPALAYGSFGEHLLLSERAQRFRVSDAQLIECLKSNPDMPVVVDWAFYFFTRPGSALRQFLAQESQTNRRLFFSQAAVDQWDQAVLQMDPFQ